MFLAITALALWGPAACERGRGVGDTASPEPGSPEAAVEREATIVGTIGRPAGTPCVECGAVATLVAPGWCCEDAERQWPRLPSGSGTLERAELSVGPAGATVSLAEVHLAIPPGALTADLPVSIERTAARAPDGYVALGPVYRFGPAGTTFGRPATLRLPAAVALPGMTVFWSVPGDDAVFEPVESIRDESVLLVSVDHFSLGFAGIAVATAPAPAQDPCAGEELVSLTASADGERAFDTLEPGVLCVTAQQSPEIRTTVTVDTEVAVIPCKDVKCIDDPGTPLVPGDPAGQTIQELARLLPGEHALQVLMATVPGSEVAVAARFVRFESESTTSSHHLFAIEEPFVDRDAFSPGVSLGSGDTVSVVTMVEALQSRGAAPSVIYQLEYTYQVVSLETGATVRRLDGAAALPERGGRVPLAASWDGTDDAGAFVSDGVYVLAVEASVVSVNPGGRRQVLDTASSVARTVQVSTSAPSLRLWVTDGAALVPFPDGSTFVTSSPELRILGKGEDAVSMTRVTVWLHGDRASNGYIYPVEPAGDFVVPVTLPERPSTTWDFMVTVSVDDVAGNSAGVYGTIHYDPAASPASAFPAQFRQALCALDARCGLGIFPADFARCTKELARDGVMEPNSDELGARLITVDAHAASECLGGLHALACEDAWHFLRARSDAVNQRCASVFVGHAGEGAACTSPVACEPGLACAESSPQSCARTCVRRTVSCDELDGPESPVCPSPLRCGPDGGCIAPRSAGEPCSVPGTRAECERGLRCIDGRCSEGAVEGAACQGIPCQDGLICATSADVPRCARPRLALREGDACRSPLAECGTGLYCDERGGVCRLTTRVGEACAPGDVPCEFGATCIVGGDADPEHDTCGWPRGDGSACGEPPDCNSGLCVDGSCAALVQEDDCGP